MSRTIQMVIFAFLGFLASSANAVTSAGSQHYVVTIDASRNGSFTVGTGPVHPVTESEGRVSNVLRGGRTSSTGSFHVLRSYGSRHDYILGTEQGYMRAQAGKHGGILNGVYP